MSTYRLTLEYDGTQFSGWQAQHSRRTVEGELRDALVGATGESPRVSAAGRTDAGVHAHGQVVGLTLERQWAPEQLLAALNAHLPEDAVVVGAQLAPRDFHARHDALRRTYRYLVVVRHERAAVLRQHAWRVPGPLDIDAMREAGRHLTGMHDFAGFGHSPRPGGTTVRTVHEVGVDDVLLRAGGVSRIEGVCITVTADAFLRGMMRAFAGALVAVGRGKLSGEDVVARVNGAPAEASLTVAPACGLHQWSVSYDDAALEDAA